MPCLHPQITGQTYSKSGGTLARKFALDQHARRSEADYSKIVEVTDAAAPHTRATGTSQRPADAGRRRCRWRAVELRTPYCGGAGRVTRGSPRRRQHASALAPSRPAPSRRQETGMATTALLPSPDQDPPDDPAGRARRPARSSGRRVSRKASGRPDPSMPGHFVTTGSSLAAQSAWRRRKAGMSRRSTPFWAS